MFERSGGSWSPTSWSVGFPGTDAGVSVSLTRQHILLGAPLMGVPTNSGRVVAYDGATCPPDVDVDGVVAVNDLLAVLADWGDLASWYDEEDIDRDGEVAVGDLLAVLAAWAACPCTTNSEPDSLCDELEDAGLDCEDALEVIYDALDSEDDGEIANMVCWLEHYLLHCTGPICTHSANCPDSDPF